MKASSIRKHSNTINCRLFLGDRLSRVTLTFTNPDVSEDSNVLRNRSNPALWAAAICLSLRL